MEDNMETAGVCGLFCESCTFYIATMEDTGLKLLARRMGRTTEEIRCKGCRSDTVTIYCKTCGMKQCADKNEYNFCSECKDYPCNMLKEFQQERPHRIELFESLDYVAENGCEAWLQKMKKEYSCEDCGTINSIYSFECRKCGYHPSNPYVGRNIQKIIEAIKK